MTRKFNDPDLRVATRMVTDEPALAIACYEGDADEGHHWNGTLVGATASVEDAEAWLRGEDVQLTPIQGNRG